MTRILADLPDEDIEKLDELAVRTSRSRAAALRDAVRAYLAQNSDNDWIQRGAGYWKGRTDIGDSIKYQRAIREDRTPYSDI